MAKELGTKQIEELKNKPKKDLTLNEHVFLLELRVARLEKLLKFTYEERVKAHYEP